MQTAAAPFDLAAFAVLFEGPLRNFYRSRGYARYCAKRRRRSGIPDSAKSVQGGAREFRRQ